MSLGLYVSSFYFFQSGKQKSSYLGLNSPIQCEDTQYSKAMNFFEDFFAAHRMIVDLESEKSCILLKRILLGVEKQRSIRILLLAYVREFMG